MEAKGLGAAVAGRREGGEEGERERGRRRKRVGLVPLSARQKDNHPKLTTESHYNTPTATTINPT